MAASCTSRAATGPLRVRTRNGHDPPRATRHLRLAVLTAARAERGPAISPACRLPRPGRSLLITRRHLACDCLRPISRVRRRECGRSHPFSTPRDSGHRVGDPSIVPLAGGRRAPCHGSDSRVDCVVVTVGDHRAVCSPQPAAADRRPPARRRLTSLNGRSAAWRRGFGESTEAWTGSGPITSEHAETCVAAGSGRQLRREGRGGRRATRARRFGVLRCLDVPPVTSTEPAPGQGAGLALANLRRSRRG